MDCSFGFANPARRTNLVGAWEKFDGASPQDCKDVMRQIKQITGDLTKGFTAHDNLGKKIKMRTLGKV